MARVLFVAPWIPGPIRPRAWGLLKMLAAEHEVWLVCYESELGDTSHLTALGLAGVSVVRHSRLRGLLGASWSALNRSEPLQVGYMKSRQFSRLLRDVCSRWLPDIAHFNVVRTSGYIGDVGATPIVFDLDERRSSYYCQVAEGDSNPIWRLVSRVEYRRLLSAERVILNSAAATLFSSPVDATSNSSRVFLVRSPYDYAIEPESAAPDLENKIIFVGRLSYRANQSALRWFLDSVWPMVIHSFPGTKLCVVGENPPDWLGKFSTSGVSTTGRVKTTAPYYSAATAAIVPITTGTGVQMKLIEALAAGVPCVTTSHCARQAGVNSSQVHVADGAQEWIESLTTILQDDSSKSSMRAAGLAWARHEYSSANITAQLQAAYASLIARRI